MFEPENNWMVVDENYNIADIVSTILENHPMIIGQPNHYLSTNKVHDLSLSNVKTNKDKAERALAIFEANGFIGWRLHEVINPN